VSNKGIGNQGPHSGPLRQENRVLGSREAPAREIRSGSQGSGGCQEAATGGGDCGHDLAAQRFVYLDSYPAEFIGLVRDPDMLDGFNLATAVVPLRLVRSPHIGYGHQLEHLEIHHGPNDCLGRWRQRFPFAGAVPVGDAFAL
jgi:hypothetical protein